MNLHLRIYIALGLFALTAEVHAACEVKKIDGHTLSRCKIWPAFNTQSIAAKATFVPDSAGAQDGVFDLALSVINATTGNTVASYAKPGAYNSDAISFDDLIIDTARYRLAADVRAFGLRSTFIATVLERIRTPKPTWLCMFAKAIAYAQCWKAWWCARISVRVPGTAIRETHAFAGLSKSAHPATTGLRI